MSAPPFQLTSFPTILHHFAPRLVAIEHLPSTSTPTAHNFILFLGGLGDGLRTVDYPRPSFPLPLSPPSNLPPQSPSPTTSLTPTPPTP